MSYREEALVSVYVAARALQRHGPTNDLLAALFAAVEAVDFAVDMPPAGPEMRSGGAGRDFRATDTDRPGLCQGDVDCWRGPITPGGVCFEHSDANQEPRPWERAQDRAGVGTVSEDDHEPA